jgi:hypothetical protein
MFVPGRTFTGTGRLVLRFYIDAGETEDELLLMAERLKERLPELAAAGVVVQDVDAGFGCVTIGHEDGERLVFHGASGMTAAISLVLTRAMVVRSMA